MAIFVLLAQKEEEYLSLAYYMIQHLKSRDCPKLSFSICKRTVDLNQPEE
jgi:hypothetical protein